MPQYFENELMTIAWSEHSTAVVPTESPNVMPW